MRKYYISAFGLNFDIWFNGDAQELEAAVINWYYRREPAQHTAENFVDYINSKDGFGYEASVENPNKQ